MKRAGLLALLLLSLAASAPAEDHGSGGPGPDDLMDSHAYRDQWGMSKASTMQRQERLLEERYALPGKPAPGLTMEHGKPVILGPLGRLDGKFPYLPLPHPAAERGHFLFPNFYTFLHPEFARVDADFDWPDSLLPEYPPGLYLTTRPDLGDVSKGVEIDLDNYKELLDGILTPQELDGVRVMLIPRQTLWFNGTEHRVTAKPAHGVSCFSCHVNGHTNGAILAEPATRPVAAQLRIDTPSLRGIGQARLLGFKRAIHSGSEFTEQEDYFEGETVLAKRIGVLKLTREEVLAVSSFLSIIDFPPAPKLGPDGRLDESKASAEELKGQALFFGKARCGSCHPAPYYSDHEMHDLKIERLTGGPPQGAFKTPTLRAITDSPPYFHDGRLPTLEDSVEFFDRVLTLRLAPEEKKSLVAFMRAL